MSAVLNLKSKPFLPFNVKHNFTITIMKNENNQFSFAVKAWNAQDYSMVSPKSYKFKSYCMRNVERVKKMLNGDVLIKDLTKEENC